METITLDPVALARIFWLAVMAFAVAMLITPVWTDVLYRFKLGKKIRDTAHSGEKATYFNKLHKGKEATPTMGGVLVWGTTAILTILFNLHKQTTLLPLVAMLLAGGLGVIDDLMNIFGIGPHRGGMRFRERLLIYTVIAAGLAYYFTVKLDWLHRAVNIPFTGGAVIGPAVAVVFFVAVMATAFAVDITDGLDGLAAGLLGLAFLGLVVIAYLQGQYGLAAFAGTVLGSLLAFLWFNIYPARFFMGGTGAMALGTALGVLCLLTNTVAILPVLGLVFWIEAASVVLQLGSKRLLKRKIFLSAPIHHHFEAIGWPETKVTMRAWIIGAVATLMAVGLAILHRG